MGSTGPLVMARLPFGCTGSPVYGGVWGCFVRPMSEMRAALTHRRSNWILKAMNNPTRPLTDDQVKVARSVEALTSANQVAPDRRLGRRFNWLGRGIVGIELVPRFVRVTNEKLELAQSDRGAVSGLEDLRRVPSMSAGNPIHLDPGPQPVERRRHHGEWNGRIGRMSGLFFVAGFSL